MGQTLLDPGGEGQTWLHPKSLSGQSGVATSKTESPSCRGQFRADRGLGVQTVPT